MSALQVSKATAFAGVRAISFFRFDFRDGVAPHHVPAKILAPLVKTLQLETCCNPGADESHAVRALATPEAFFFSFFLRRVGGFLMLLIVTVGKLLLLLLSLAREMFAGNAWHFASFSVPSSE